MIHNESKKQQHSHIWFSFILGSIIGASGLFLIGTSQGRKLLKKVIEMVENMEDQVADMIASMEEEVKEKNISLPLHTVLQKIQTVLPRDKEIRTSSIKNNRPSK